MNSLTQMGIHYVCKLGTIYKYPIQLDCSLFFANFVISVWRYFYCTSDFESAI